MNAGIIMLALEESMSLIMGYLVDEFKVSDTLYKLPKELIDQVPAVHLNYLREEFMVDSYPENQFIMFQKQAPKNGGTK